WYRGDGGNVAVVVELPLGGAALASATIASYLPAVGLNGHGLAQRIDSLSAPDDRIGLPRVLVSRYAPAARDPDDAVARATIPGRAGGYADVFAARGGRARSLETPARAHAVLDGTGGHTNHYLARDLHGDASDGSLARYERLAELLRERPPATPEDAMEL